VADVRHYMAITNKNGPRSARAISIKVSGYTLNEDPQPQVLFTFGFSNLNPAPSKVSR
jgi:hypothetical protein